MSVRVAIIADDLTGALDTSTPFVEAALSVVVAARLDGLAEALSRNPDVVAINTASRGLDAGTAAALVTQAIAALGAERPEIIFKKIDSRLKGNVAAEATALALATARAGLVMAPAVPDQQRFTRDEMVVGRGVETPLSIRTLFGEANEAVAVINAESDADLDALVARQDWRQVVAVGARGLGVAFARHLGKAGAMPVGFEGACNTLFAFGSRDPITAAQIGQLCTDHRGIRVLEAPNGRLPLPGHERVPLVLQCTGALTADAWQVARQFGAGVAAFIGKLDPATLVMGGGDTALAILDALGVDVLAPQGEAAPGVPWFIIEPVKGRRMRCVVKSGGFGDIGVLAALIELPSQKTVLVS